MPPLLYLVRHAHADAAADDSLRPVSARGRAEIKQLAAAVRASRAFRPAEAWYSPLVRARETAELLLTELGLKVTPREHAALIPEADPATIAAALADVRVPLALFGHEPHMSALATLLVTGDTSPLAFAFQKATMLALEPAGTRCWVRWQISPDLFA
jgi:phosphohistidine phosphatase